MVPCTVSARSFQAWASRAGRAVVVQGRKQALKYLLQQILSPQQITSIIKTAAKVA
jgi:hypothetical protein